MNENYICVFSLKIPTNYGPSDGTLYESITLALYIVNKVITLPQLTQESIDIITLFSQKYISQHT